MKRKKPSIYIKRQEEMNTGRKEAFLGMTPALRGMTTKIGYVIKRLTCLLSRVACALSRSSIEGGTRSSQQHTVTANALLQLFSTTSIYQTQPSAERFRSAKSTHPSGRDLSLVSALAPIFSSNQSSSNYISFFVPAALKST